MGGEDRVLHQTSERAHVGGRDHARDQPHDLAEEVRKRKMRHNSRKKNQEGKQRNNEVVGQCRSKCHGMVLLHIANHISCCVFEME